MTKDEVAQLETLVSRCHVLIQRLYCLEDANLKPWKSLKISSSPLESSILTDELSQAIIKSGLDAEIAATELELKSIRIDLSVDPVQTQAMPRAEYRAKQEFS